MKGIVAPLILHMQADQETTPNPNSQAKDIDEGVYLVLIQISERDFDVIFEHRIFLLTDDRSFGLPSSVCCLRFHSLLKLSTGLISAALTD